MTSSVAYVRSGQSLTQTIAALIDGATESVLLQMYLFAGNDELVLLQPRSGAEPWAQAVADRLIAKRRASPGVAIVVVLDTQTPEEPLLTRRGRGPLIRQRLEEAGVVVLNASLERTRFDADRRFPAAATLHRVPPTLRVRDGFVRRQQAWQTWHNVEDHRKNLVVDRGRWALVTSRNFLDLAHDWHDNALLLGGAAARAVFTEAQDALRRALELPQRIADAARPAVGSLSEGDPHPAGVDAQGPPGAPALHTAEAEVVPQPGLRARILDEIAAVASGGTIDVASTYFSAVDVLGALIAAARRGVRVRVLIDDCRALTLPAFEAWFVRTFVNLRVLVAAAGVRVPGFELRVVPSAKGAMMHLKSIGFGGDRPRLLCGQANLTPNTLELRWLDTVVIAHGPSALAAFQAHFEDLWPLGRPAAAVRWWAWPGVAARLALLRLAEALGFRP